MGSFFTLLIILNALRVSVISEPLPPQYGGLYEFYDNEIILNDEMPLYVAQDVLVHEAVHVAQDCVDGIENATLEPLTDGEQIPQEIKDRVNRVYFGAPQWVLDLEYEAAYYTDKPYEVMSYLRYHCFDE